ncbi:D-inositol 3-phosphate glycosyltransferase [Planctomycetaceae bacterium]|nr:D-inositol 3-phosphate glycosyltransferase [Planctomycetaceae bacterium]
MRADVYHITGDVHYLSLGLPRERTLLTIHDCVFATQTRGLRRFALRKTFYEWAIAHAARVTVISETVRRELIELVPAAAEKTQIVPCCLPERFAYSPREFAATPEVLLVGTTPNKNLGRVLEALRGLPCRIHVVGRLDGAQKAALAATGAKTRNSIDLRGDAMVAAYREADIVALVSTYEGFGLPIIEAQAVGRVVVASNASSLPEASGGAAILVDPLDVAAIRAGLERALSDAALRAELIERGRANASRFAPTKVAAAYAALYEQLASKP